MATERAESHRALFVVQGSKFQGVFTLADRTSSQGERLV
jgi:hypothetical protein